MRHRLEPADALPRRGRAKVFGLWLACGLLSTAPLAGHTQVQAPASNQAPPASKAAAKRPKVCLVLSGGGARGLAHVGVLKVLEREHIPIDCIAGTSMGAIVGGLYASGMSAAQIESEVSRIDWDAAFASRVERPELSLRRKEQDFELPPLVEFGVSNGQLRAPNSAVSSRGLEILLRRYTLPARHVSDFDHLPIPFRAVATDMETGQAVILREGDLALALRSSMSVPGLFAPTEVGGRILGDGGLVRNTPVDVARDMAGSDPNTVLIVANIGTPLAPRDTLGTLGGVTAQMINILTEQNVQRSLADLHPQDVLIAPKLEGLTASDFQRSAEFIAQGEIAADAAALRLTPLALPASDYSAWRQAHLMREEPAPTLAFVRFDGSKITHPEFTSDSLSSRVGKPFNEANAERDARHLAASGDYARADYRLVTETSTTGAPREGLVFDLEDKPWGPSYLRMGLDLSADNRGVTHFNLKLAHTRRWLDERGSEWRSFLRLGTEPTLASEWFRPLRRTIADTFHPFASISGSISSRDLNVYASPQGPEAGRLNRLVRRFGGDWGVSWRELGELRLGWQQEAWRDTPELLAAGYTGPLERSTRRESALRARVVFDQLDFAYFPRSGWRAEAQSVHVMHSTGGAISIDAAPEHFGRYEAQAQGAWSWGPHTLNLFARLAYSDKDLPRGSGRYSLGGFQQLSGYSADQVVGDDLAFVRLGYYVRLGTPALTRGLFAGATLEAGNAWLRHEDVKLSDLRNGASLYLGADTAFGPLYLATVYAPAGGRGVMIFLGRP